MTSRLLAMRKGDELTMQSPNMGMGSTHKYPRRMIIAMAIILSGVNLAGCGVVQSQGKTSVSSSHAQVVTLWESHSPALPAGKSMQALVDQFNRTHQKIHVDLTVTKASRKALAALPVGNAPVLAEISHYDGNYIKAHVVKSWNPYIGHGLSLSVTQSLYHDIWHNGEVNGQHYRLEADAKVSQLTYNQSIFAKVGIRHVPTTWAQLAADVNLIKARDPQVVPLAWKDASDSILPFLLSNGGHIYQTGSQEKAAAFRSAAAANTFSYFREMYQHHEMIFGSGTEIHADFGVGKLAIADGTSAGYQKNLEAAGGKFPVGVFPYPQGSTGHTSNLVQGLGFVLMKGHSQAQDKAAVDFVNWFLSPKQQAYWGEHSGYPTETAAGYHAIPSRFLSEHIGLVVANRILQSSYTISRPVPDAYSEVQAAMDSQFYNAVVGRSSVPQALTTLERQANNYLSGKSAL